MLTSRDLPLLFLVLFAVLLGVALAGAALMALGWPWWLNLLVLLVVVNGVGLLLVRAGERWGLFGGDGPPDLRDDIDWFVRRWRERFPVAGDREAAVGELVVRIADYADGQNLNSRGRRHLLQHLEVALREAGLEERETRLVCQQLGKRLAL